MNKLGIHTVALLTHYALSQGWVKNRFSLLLICLLLSPFEAVPAESPKAVRETAGNLIPDRNDEMHAAIMTKRSAATKPGVAAVVHQAPTVKALETALASGRIPTHFTNYLWSIADRRRINPAFLGHLEKGQWKDVRLTTRRVSSSLISSDDARQFSMLNERGQPVRVIDKWMRP